MANVSFSTEERDRAKKAGTVMLSFSANGRHLPGFPYKEFEIDEQVTPEQAMEAVAWFTGFLSRIRTASNPQPPFPGILSNLAAPQPLSVPGVG